MNKIYMLNMIISLLIFSIFTGCGSTNDDKVPESDIMSEKAEQQSSLQKTVKLTPEQANSLKIKTVQVNMAKTRFKIVVPGIINPAPEGISYLSSPVSGRISKITYHEGETVKKGVLLAELESLEYANLLSDFLQANAQLSYTEKQMKRLETLVEQKISSQQVLEKIQAEYDRINASVMSSQARLKAVGVTDNEIRSWGKGEKPHPNLKIRATLNGTINDHFISLGQSVEANENILSIVNLSEILIIGFVPPEDASFITKGNEVILSQVTNKDRNIITRIKSLRPTLDPVNRSINVYALAAPIDNWPTPGENVRLEIEAWTSKEMIAVPSSSVAYYGQQSIVFVNSGENRYVPAEVKIFRETPGLVILSSGLKDGDNVAISQVFSLKALLKFELFAE